MRPTSAPVLALCIFIGAVLTLLSTARYHSFLAATLPGANRLKGEVVTGGLMRGRAFMRSFLHEMSITGCHLPAGKPSMQDILKLQ